MNLEIFFRRRWFDNGGENSSRDFIFFVTGHVPVANGQLLKMWRREVPILHAPIMASIFSSTRSLWARSYFFEPLVLSSNYYHELNAAPPVLWFTAEEEAEGKRNLANWGINMEHDWFVCIFARDAEYLDTFLRDKDSSYHGYRNADIGTFHLAIKEIVAHGGYVIRMGSQINKKLNIPSAGVIDYATKYRSDFMDIYLAAKCRFFLGTQSGIMDVGLIFDRPQLGVDCAPFGVAPPGKQCLFIPKLLSDPRTGEVYTIGHLLKTFSNWNDPKRLDGNLAFQLGYKYIDNTPEEILEVTREMLDRLDGKYRPSAEDEMLQKLYFSLMSMDHCLKEVKTPIGADFIRLHKDLLRPWGILGSS